MRRQVGASLCGEKNERVTRSDQVLVYKPEGETLQMRALRSRCGQGVGAGVGIAWVGSTL